MGTDKGKLQAGGGMTFVRLLIRNLSSFEDFWLSTGREDPCPGLCVSRISDRYPDAGPLAGLESILTVCRHDMVFVTAVDLPYADSELARELYVMMEKEPDLDAILMEDSRGRKQHLLGIYKRRVLPVLREQLDRGDLTLRDFLARIRVRYVKADRVTDGAVKTLTCNTRQEYEKHFGQTAGTFPEPAIPVISVTGWSGSGKTTFLERLLPCLKEEGLRVACLKHDAHHFDVDREGKDSWRLTMAGADMTGIFSEEKAVWMENRRLTLEAMLACVHDVDLILLEGGSLTDYPKILVYREELGKGLRVPAEECLAVISDDRVEGAPRQFGFDRSGEAAAFICDWCRKRAIQEDK